jgi:hypothetical protein
MSAISGAGANLFQYLQQLSSSNSATSATSSSALSDLTATSSAPAVAGGHHHGGHGGGMKKLQDAVTSALQSAQQGGSSSDPNQVIEDAITKFLKGSMGIAAGSTAAGSSATAGADATDATDQTNAGDTTQSTFAQMLKSFGVDAQQFHNDFTAAIKDAQGGQINPATAFQNVPTGSLIDEMG